MALELTDLTHKSNEFQWTTTCAEGFEVLKAKLTSAPILQVYDPKHEVWLWINASDFTIGVTLVQ